MKAKTVFTAFVATACAACAHHHEASLHADRASIRSGSSGLGHVPPGKTLEDAAAYATMQNADANREYLRRMPYGNGSGAVAPAGARVAYVGVGIPYGAHPLEVLTIRNESCADVTLKWQGWPLAIAGSFVATPAGPALPMNLTAVFVLPPFRDPQYENIKGTLEACGYSRRGTLLGCVSHEHLFHKRGPKHAIIATWDFGGCR